MHLFLAHYLEPSIVYIISFPGGNSTLAELNTSQIEQRRNLYPMTTVACVFPPLGVLVAVLDCCTVRTT